MQASSIIGTLATIFTLLCRQNVTRDIPIKDAASDSPVNGADPIMLNSRCRGNEKGAVSGPCKEALAALMPKSVMTGSQTSTAGRCSSSNRLSPATSDRSSVMAVTMQRMVSFLPCRYSRVGPLTACSRTPLGSTWRSTLMLLT